jgi:hypothetical protein
MNLNKPRCHNAKRCRLTERHAVIYALANDESVESIRRTLHASRHTVLAIREQYPHEIEAAQARIKGAIEAHYFELAHEAMDKIGRLIPGERSMMKLLKIYDKLTDKAQALDTPVQKHPQPLSIKLAALRRAKRNESCDRSVWHEGET